MSAMGAVWLRLRAELRQQWRVWLALAVLLGVIGGIALTAAAGARRTDTAYPRFLRASHAAQLAVFPALSGFGGYFRAIARLPEVSSSASAAFLQMSLPGPDAGPFSGLTAEASPAGDDGISLDRVRVLAGRLFDPADPHAVMISQQLAVRQHLRPGGTLQLIGYPQQGPNPDVRHKVRLAFRVSAVVAFTDQVVGASYPRLLLSPAFARTRQAMSFNPAGGALYLVLRPHAATAFTRQATALAARYRVGDTQIAHLATTYAAAQRGIRPEAAALAIFAGLASLIALAIIGQLLSRQLALDSAEFPVLRALGMSPSRLAVLSLARVAMVTITGAAVAVGLAIAASPLMPIGPARSAEPSPGVEVNLAILGAGFVLIAAAPLLVTVPAALRAANRARGAFGLAEPTAPVRPSRLSPVLGLAGSVPGSLGVRMAFEPGHGRTAVPVRSALVGTTVAVAAVAAAMVFGASFLALVGTPHLYGQNWPQELNLQAGAVPAAIGEKVLAQVKDLTGYAGGDYGQVSVAAPGSTGGTVVPAIGLDALHGSRFLTLLAGRAPAGPDEIALGPRTLRTLGMHVGQRVKVTADNRTFRMRIVGSAVFAAFSVGGNTPTDLGTGAAVAASVLSQPNPPICTGGATCYNFFLLRYRPGANLRLAAAQLNRAATRSHCPPGLCVVATDQRPSDIENFTGIRDTPLILGAVLVLLAVGTLAHVLLTGVRRRRRDLAVLKTLGLLRPQLLRLVSWQATALAVAALLVGLPLGLLAGRWAWLVFAGSAGVGNQADVPVPLVLLVIPVTLVLAVLLAVVPGWTAARIRPALILRSE